MNIGFSLKQLNKTNESMIICRQNCESCHSDTENDLNDVPMDCENDNSDHVLENTPKHDADDTVESSAKNSPIPFRSVPRRKRRNTNKTGKYNEMIGLAFYFSVLFVCFGRPICYFDLERECLVLRQHD